MINNLLVYLRHQHVISWNFTSSHQKIIQSAFPKMDISVCQNSKEFMDRLDQADAALVWRFKEEWLEKAPKLRLVATPAVGTDWVQLPKNLSGPKVWFASMHAAMMAECVVGAMFYFCKAFQFSKDMQKRKKWARLKVSAKLKSLRHARVTILGFGRIGKEVGRMLKPFACQITGVKRTPCEQPGYFTSGDRIVTVDRIEEVLPVTDHLVMALPGGHATDGMFKREYFRALPEHCHIYNVGRGNLYKESDLAEALKNGEIAGAYLDVFATEPLPETSPLWEMENVLIQPHTSAAGPEYLDLYVEEFISRLKIEYG